jgi:hypothetical protein
MESIEVLGKEMVRRRLRQASDFLLALPAASSENTPAHASTPAPAGKKS